ncbi:hypothetical protein GGH94_000578 [Coemansia aciculifera]|uniref:Uncharacterized protein n=1 Tax=Coemansia aciculifera TaxID=417176 RepID=A0A9W8IU79_9FUNG|nr:hypothetical protein GGH94_000578 [Coemansia aciculifera]
MSIFDTWTTITVRGLGTSSPEVVYRLQCAGGYCAVCEKCQHRCLVSPNIHNSLLCPHCQEPLVLPLGAHFTCPARLEPQFAIKQPFDIERFLAYRTREQANDSAQSSGDSLRWDGSNKHDNTGVSCVFVGFMDLVEIGGCAHKLTHCTSCRESSDGPHKRGVAGGKEDGFIRLLDQTSPLPLHTDKPRSRGFWSALVKRCSGISTKSEKRQRQNVRRHVLAVVDSRHITWYGVTGGREDDQFRRVEQIALSGTQFSADSSTTGARIVVATRSGRKIEMDLGSRIVANMWFHVLGRRGAIKGGYTAYNGEPKRWTVADGANVYAFNNIADGYSSSGLAGDDDDISEFQFDVGSNIIEPHTAAAVGLTWLEGSRSGSGSQAVIRLVPI